MMVVYPAGSNSIIPAPAGMKGATPSCAPCGVMRSKVELIAAAISRSFVDGSLMCSTALKFVCTECDQMCRQAVWHSRRATGTRVRNSRSHKDRPSGSR